MFLSSVSDERGGGVSGGVAALEGERKTQLVAGIPVGRNGTVADLITHLCREESGTSPQSPATSTVARIH